MWDYYEGEITLDVLASFISSNQKKERIQMMTSKERVFKINKAIWMTKSRVIQIRILIPKQ